MDYPFAERRKRMQSSLIRELLKLASRPGVLSLGGGVPAAELFPMEEIQRATAEVLQRYGAKALQYSPTEGFRPLREWIAARLGVEADWVLITSGSQQAIDLVGRVFIDEGDPVVVESPTYMGGLLALNPYAPRYLTVETDAQGAKPEALPEKAKLAYILPSFQNPTGALMDAPRRRAVAQWAERAGVVVLEDDPYGHIYFDAPPPPPIFTHAKARVIYAGTFSKLIAPGLRLGYVVADPGILAAIIQAKQATDLHSNILGQVILAELIDMGLMEAQAERVRVLYRRRRDRMAEALRAHLDPEVAFDVPQGGMFFWLRFPEGTDTRALLDLALEAGVAFVPGEPFFAHTPYPAARLTFASVAEDQIEEGIRRLARAYERYKTRTLA